MLESGAGRTVFEGAPIVLRLLPHVHHPPARVWVPAGEAEARALDARGYRVTAASPQAGWPGIAASIPAAGSMDMVCETGAFRELDHRGRVAYAEAVAAVLRPGGLLFGAFPADGGGSMILTLLASRFDAARLEPSRHGDWLEAIFVRR